MPVFQNLMWKRYWTKKGPSKNYDAYVQVLFQEFFVSIIYQYALETLGRFLWSTFSFSFKDSQR